MRILKVSQCRKTRKGGPFGLLKTSVCCKISKNLKSYPLAKKKLKKSRTVPKNIQSGDPVVPSGFVSYVKNWVHERGTLCTNLDAISLAGPAVL